MGRRNVIKWERTHNIRPVHNFISSDFPKYYPQPWKFMNGPAYMNYLMSFEYQRMWIKERDAWKKRMYPESNTVNIDVVKRYVQSFKNVKPKPKPEEKKPFRMKQFENIPPQTTNRRPPNDKAMSYLQKAKETIPTYPKNESKLKSDSE